MPAPPSDPLIGQILDGRYQVTRVLGTGGMGTVYEARQERLGRNVAIKTIHGHLATKGVVVERFRREAMAAASAGSPHIVEVYDLGALPTGAPYMVMELLAGEDLRTRVERSGPLSVSAAAHVISQACDALEAAHERGIVHRDVKPENIMVMPRRADEHFVKVVDFGISKLRDSSLTGSHEMLGTPYAMAPEQLHGAGQVDARADVYGLGVSLYFALSGEVPYDADHLPLLVAQIASGEAVPLRRRRPNLPPGIYDIVATATAIDPRARFQSARALAAALKNFEAAADPFALAPTEHAASPVQAQPRSRGDVSRPASAVSRPARGVMQAVQPPPRPPAPPRSLPAVPQPRAPSLDARPVLAQTTATEMFDSAADVDMRIPTTAGSKLAGALMWLLVLAVIGVGGAFAYDRYGARLGLRSSPARDVEAREAEARAEAERAMQRHEAERIEAERIEAERIEAERIEAERVVEGERAVAEPGEIDRIIVEHLDRQRAAERAEAERAEALRASTGADALWLPHDVPPREARALAASAGVPVAIRGEDGVVRRYWPPTQLMRATMEAAASSEQGNLNLYAVVDARLWLDGAPCRLPCRRPVAAGQHRVRVRYSDGQTQSVTFRVRPGATIERMFLAPGRDPVNAPNGVVTPRVQSMQSMQSDQGVLQINTTPWSTVFIDGTERGTTPGSFPVSAGAHRVDLRAEDGRTNHRTVSVEAGETTRVMFRF